MRKKWITLLLCLVLCAVLTPAGALAADEVAIDGKNFPDAVLREYVLSEFDTDGNEALSAEEIDLAGSGVKALNSISYFPNLKVLDVSGTPATELNLSANTALERLSAAGCNMKALDVSMLPELRELDISGTKIAVLNLAENPRLEALNVAECPIRTLDLTGHEALKLLDVTGIKYAGLDVSAYKDMEVLRCARTGIAALDVSMLPGLRELDVSGNQLTALDVSANDALESLRCGGNAITALDVTNCPLLTVLECGGNRLEMLDVSNNGALETLDCSENGLFSLDLYRNAALKSLNCSKNSLSELDLGSNSALEQLDCSYNTLPYMNVSGLSGLTALNCCRNWLSELDLSRNSALEQISCWGNNIHGLDIRSNPMLMRVFVDGAYKNTRDCTTRTWTDENNRVYEISTDPDTMLQDGSVAGPAISTQLWDLSVEAGKTVTFTISASGQDLTYRWYVQQPLSAGWTRLDGANAPSLTFKADSRLNGNRYRCEVLNRGGTAVSSTARLTVISKPRILTQPQDRAVVEGQKATFSVVADGEGMTYQWYRMRTDESDWVKLDGETKSSLTVNAKMSRDRNQYHCVIKNAAGKVTTNNVKLVVITEPEVTGQPETVTVKKGKTVTFKVKATGGALSYQWFVKKAGSDEWTILKGETSRTLTLKVTKKMDGNKYRCRIDNKAGRVNSKAATLHVN